MKYNREFRRLYTRCKSVAGSYLVLYYRKTGADKSIMGITVTKKIGKAHTRNLIRRRIKESYRLKEGSLKRGYNFVFVARSKAVLAPYRNLSREMEALLIKSGIAENSAFGV